MARFASAPVVASAFVVGALGLGACSSRHPPPVPPGPPSAPLGVVGARPSTAGELSPALAPLAWWLGDWQAADGASEHWLANGGALFGLTFDGKGGFEVLIVDDGEGPGPADGKLFLLAMPGGAPPTRFELRALTGLAAEFASATHDDPTSLRYARVGPTLVAELAGPAGPRRFSFAPGAAELAPELEAADLAFAADTAARGIDGWLSAFEPGGWQLLGGRKASGEDIRAIMGPFLAETEVTWRPVASQRRGDLGFTLGKATFKSKQDGTSWQSVYVTLWHRQPDGAWKVRFDTGRTVNGG